MARCKNEALLSKIGVEKINKLMEVDFSVLTDTDKCMKVNTKNYLGTTGTSAAYNAYRVPEDMFNCLAEGCRNSGSLMMSGTAGAAVGATFAVPYDATDFFAGVCTYYLYFMGAGSYEVTAKVSDISDRNQKNADVYGQEVTVAGEGFLPFMLDFSTAPKTQEGTGWAASVNGAVVGISVKNKDDSLAPNAGVSSLYFYSSLEDFEVNDVVKVGCLDEIAGDLTVDPVDASCWAAEYDPTSISIERTITARSVTPNYWKLNPLLGKGDKTDGWVIKSIEKEVLPVTVNNVKYGYVQLTDMQMDECGFTTAAISGKCNVTDSALSRVNTPIPVALGERQFIILDGRTTVPDDAGKILLNEAMVGLNIAVSYPQKASIEQLVASDDRLGETRVRMSFKETHKDGVEYVYVYNNVLITSFPQTINNEETTFEFTLSIQRDGNGNFFEKNRILD